MSILSEREIISELGRGILFYPLKENSIKPCSLCLTASEYAYAIRRQKCLEVKQDKQGKFFLLPPNDTILIWTDESIWLSQYFCATLHSRVEIVSLGIGHIGTRINPSWIGVLCIPFNNYFNKPVRIDIQNSQKPIAYLIIHKLRNKSSTTSNIDRSGRLDIIALKPKSDKIIKWLVNPENLWMTDREKLKQVLEKTKQYKEIKTRFLQRWFLLILGADLQTKWIAIAGIMAILGFLLQFFSFVSDKLIPFIRQLLPYIESLIK
jgi:deoxycytidine triphosphate deaminase